MDANRGSAALLIGLLLGQGQPLVYLTGLTAHRAAVGYRGQPKTDVKDAHVIADQARVRQDLGLLRPGDEVAVDLRVLTSRRLDLVNDRTRHINRLREQLLGIFPALERALPRKGRGWLCCWLAIRRRVRPAASVPVALEPGPTSCSFARPKNS